MVLTQRLLRRARCAAQDVTLDFFGCAVKAADLSHHLGSMAILAQRIDALTAAQQDPFTAFRLEAAAVPPAVKWGKAIGWNPRDDAALLLGVYYYGLGHWEKVIGDERLGLNAKLACVLAGKDEGAASVAATDKALQPKGGRAGCKRPGCMLGFCMQCCNEACLHMCCVCLTCCMTIIASVLLCC